MHCLEFSSDGQRQPGIGRDEFDRYCVIVHIVGAARWTYKTLVVAVMNTQILRTWRQNMGQNRGYSTMGDDCPLLIGRQRYPHQDFRLFLNLEPVWYFEETPNPNAKDDLEGEIASGGVTNLRPRNQNHTHLNFNGLSGSIIHVPNPNKPLGVSLWAPSVLLLLLRSFGGCRFFSFALLNFLACFVDLYLMTELLLHRLQLYIAADFVCSLFFCSGWQWLDSKFDRGAEICGAIVSVRTREERIARWTKNDSNEAAQVNGNCFLSRFAAKEDIGFMQRKTQKSLALYDLYSLLFIGGSESFHYAGHRGDGEWRKA
ncbi:hypothetical protein DKX38_025470 [Salix brachista]|uniref:Uncharacterized protein n=1 Tax=Salix brachista TaxID=2182728 RepID=A0A5N5JP14_9ROSI|nr:hypothetical protein DKX38_025470 [Salix brachista]